MRNITKADRKRNIDESPNADGAGQSTSRRHAQASILQGARRTTFRSPRAVFACIAATDGAPGGVVQIEIGIADRDLRQDRTKLFLALRLHDNYMLFIEFRPNDLASPHVVRLTDDPPPDLDLTDCVWRGLNYTHSKDDLP